MKNKFFLLIGLPIVLISLTFFIFRANANHQNILAKKNEIEIKNKLINQDTTLSLFFVGDVMGHMPMISAAKLENQDKYEYNNWFKYFKTYVEKFDFSVANLEVTLGGKPYSGYPQFCSPDSYAEAVKLTGFDFLITANNHSQDRGKKGLERTIDVLDSLNIAHTGTFKSNESREKDYPFIKIIKGKKLAILNYTYGTNGLVVTQPNIVNMIDTTQIKIDIQKAKKLATDFLLVTLHWGSEYQRKQNKMQSDLAQWLCDQGVDAIIGMHPHVVQPMEILHPKNNKTKIVPVAYSLGNFVSNQRAQFKDGGIAVAINLKIANEKITFSNWSFLPFWIQLGGNPKGYYVIPVSDWEKNPSKYQLSESEKIKIKQFATDTRILLKGNVEM